MKEKREEFNFTGILNNTKSVAFSPNGNFIAGGTWNKIVKIWNLKEKRPYPISNCHSGSVLKIAIAPYENLLDSESKKDIPIISNINEFSSDDHIKDSFSTQKIKTNVATLRPGYKFGNKIINSVKDNSLSYIAIFTKINYKYKYRILHLTESYCSNFLLVHLEWGFDLLDIKKEALVDPFWIISYSQNLIKY